MSIHAVKGVEIGLGFAQTRLMGSKVHDIIEPWAGGAPKWTRRGNNAGGLEGGMTTGQPIVMRVAIKPISTLAEAAAVGGHGHRRGGRGALRAQRTSARCRRAASSGKR